ncbi:MAG: NAD(P)(+) transhydrogenase (Re/Si-specific) subunit beta [Alphaproteobacteria bacterium]|nr:NAD(P)(+) transhydrogenase (Re/Si-specific) subunit beta [Alphaproteobacteria bacterium]
MTHLIIILIYSAFIVSIYSLSSPKIAYKGNILAIFSMLLIILIYYQKLPSDIFIKSLIPLTLGAIVGIYSSKIKFKNLPQMIAILNGFGGLSSALIGISSFLLKNSNLTLLIFIISLGFITFFGSLASFISIANILKIKYYKTIKSISIISFFLILLTIPYLSYTNSISLFFIIFLSSLSGFCFTLPIGGADMPIIISMLNSLSGWTTVLIGIISKNTLLIITGTLIGASGAILSYIMLKSMGRNLLNVLFFTPKTQTKKNSRLSQINQASPKEVAFLLENSKKIIIVPGFGMATSSAEHELKTLSDILQNTYNVTVKFAIHPVAGRMPGHLNILLAEASIPDNIIYELKDINNDFQTADIALVVGANDITNPLAKTDSSSPIYRMPILEVEKATKIIFIKRSLAPGYSGIDNPLFYNNKTLMIFGNAKDILQQIISALE